MIRRLCIDPSFSPRWNKFTFIVQMNGWKRKIGEVCLHDECRMKESHSPDESADGQLALGMTGGRTLSNNKGRPPPMLGLRCGIDALDEACDGSTGSCANCFSNLANSSSSCAISRRYTRFCTSTRYWSSLSPRSDNVIFVKFLVIFNNGTVYSPIIPAIPTNQTNRFSHLIDLREYYFPFKRKSERRNLRSVVGHESPRVALDLQTETLHDGVGPLACQNVRQLGKKQQRQRRARRGQDQSGDRDEGQSYTVGHQIRQHHHDPWCDHHEVNAHADVLGVVQSRYFHVSVIVNTEKGTRLDKINFDDETTKEERKKNR